jgi:hypothetical protein
MLLVSRDRTDPNKWNRKPKLKAKLSVRKAAQLRTGFRDIPQENLMIITTKIIR